MSVSVTIIKCSIEKKMHSLPLKLFRATVANADTGSLSFPCNIWYVFEPQAGENWTKSYMIRIIHFELLDKTRLLKTFWQSIYAILEDVSVSEILVECFTLNLNTTIFQRSKNYGSPTRVTRLKVAPYMADPK